ncbi:MAG: acyl carrier protein [Succinivibrio sp.]|nr:acyl carrier protein [Succinivibrio sp.]
MKRDDIIEYILQQLEQKYELDRSGNMEDLRYLETGYIDSLGLASFVLALEEQFAFRFSGAELTSPQAQTVGGLADLILQKITQN